MRKLALPFVFITSILIALATARIIPLGLDLAFPGMAHQIANAKTWFLLHIIASSVALALGAFQMLPKFRMRHLNIHRWTGRTYAIAVLSGGIAGLLISFQINGPFSTVGFAILAVLWLLSTAKAVWHARSRQIDQHRRWMIISFSLTFAAVTLRIQLLMFAAIFAMPYEQVYPFLAWSCWVPNVLFAIWYLNRNPMLEPALAVGQS